MAVKTPLALYGGIVGQLQPGDTLAGVGGGVVTEVKAASFTAVKDYRYIITANSVVVTLPAAPAQGDTIGFVAAVDTITGTVIGRNSLKIMSLAENLTVDMPNFFFSLTYHDATQGWRIT